MENIAYINKNGEWHYIYKTSWKINRLYYT